MVTISYQDAIPDAPEGLGAQIKDVIAEMDDLRILSIVHDHAHQARVHQVAAKIRNHFRHVIVVGTGGSALGARALQQALGLQGGGGAQTQAVWPSRSSGLSVHFLDNVDAASLEHLCAILDLKETLVLAISKSGGTIETLALTSALEERFNGADLNFRKHCMILTSPHTSALQLYARQLGIDVIEHDPNVGGRFSVFSNVGLLPFVLMGGDMAQFIRGAADVMVALKREMMDHPAVHGARRYHYYDSGAHVAIQVFMPYADCLRELTRWMVQLYAESLGKQGQGLTPLPALGSVDQHAQLQLFYDGPADKWVTFMTARKLGGPVAFSRHEGLEPFASLAGKSLHDLNLIEASATMQSLHANQVPIRHVEFQEIDSYALGKFMMFCILEVILAARLMNINPFDQPGVEDSKRRIKDLLTE